MSQLEEIRDEVLSHPFHRSCELELVTAADGRATTRFQVNDFTTNPGGALHGGILYAMLDVTSFFAAVSALEPGQHPVSIEVSTSVMRAAGPGDTIRVEAWADRIGRSIACLRAEATAENDKGERLIATGSVTKSIIRRS